MCLIGPIGAGKTTAIKMILGLVKPDAGQIKVFEEDPWDNMDLRSRMGVVYENPAFPARQQVLEYLETVCRIYGVAESRAKELLVQADIEEISHRRIRALSVGTLQKFALVHALINKPKLLIGDEIAANLDPVTRGNLVDLILKLSKEEKVSLLLSSRVFPELGRICDSVAIMDKGKVWASGKLEDLYEEFPSKTVSISTDQPKKLAELVKSLSYVHHVITDSKGISVKVTGKTENSLTVDVSRLARKDQVKILKIESVGTSFEELYRQVLSQEGEKMA
jgi:ABC-2 type transport system ATP-binding protein